ncbi:MAG: MerR family redox-sensitive transcriptional activator SoxR [Paraglaciecola sp.]
MRNKGLYLTFSRAKGLFHGWRNQGNQRRYKPDVIRRFAIIKAAQKLGISLSDIKQAFCVLPDNTTPNKAQLAAMSA